jgi:uncharacterized protein (TIGR00251 family)
VLFVRLTPKAGRDAIDGVDTGADGKAFMKARVSAAPVDGKANAALILLIASICGVPKSTVRIISGETSRLKQVEITGDGQKLAAAGGIAKIIGAQI